MRLPSDELAKDLPRTAARISRRGRSLVIDTTGRRRLTRSQKAGVAGVATLAGVSVEYYSRLERGTIAGASCALPWRARFRSHQP